MRRNIVGIALMWALAAGAVFAHHGSAMLGTVRITQAVVAGDQTLQPGTYEIRDTGEHPKPMPGQAADAMTNVELLADGRVVARTAAELLPGQALTVGTSGETGAETSAATSGQTRGRQTQPVVQLLKGGDFVRVSGYHNGERYLIHLPVANK